MGPPIPVDASPEKRLFISLITRDISLEDAFLDLIDNSINAALEPLADDLKTADDYQRLLADDAIKPTTTIALTISPTGVSIEDTAGGISATTAQKHVFKFGRAEEESDDHDRLSVYGIGLKRAMFKLGRRIQMTSDHVEGGFDLDLDVANWAKDPKTPWTFDIEARKAASVKKCGTLIKVSELNKEVTARLNDGVFVENLKVRIGRTYSFFIGRIVTILVNGAEVPGVAFAIGSNYASEKFELGQVTCNVTAGIAAGTGTVFRDRDAGWFVFCNGRAIIFADKTTRTGWGGAGLPIFQPKHRPFLGTVFFVSTNPEALPWTTTKGSVNEESAVWQEAKRHMVAVGRIVSGFLDKRYTEDGTEIPTADLKEASGATVSVLAAAVSQKRSFTPPKKPPPAEIRIQYDAKVADIEKIAEYIKRPSWSGAKIGRYTFDFFLRNEVKDSE